MRKITKSTKQEHKLKYQIDTKYKFTLIIIIHKMNRLLIVTHV